jgi:hypothetical protein
MQKSGGGCAVSVGRCSGFDCQTRVRVDCLNLIEIRPRPGGFGVAYQGVASREEGLEDRGTTRRRVVVPFDVRRYWGRFGPCVSERSVVPV